jgi:cation transport ATPase
MQTLFATNLKCNACLNKIKPSLDNEPTIENWDVDLTSPQKILRVQLAEPDGAASVIQRLAEHGFTASLIDGNAESSFSTATSSNAGQATQQPIRFSTYKPLLLVVAYVLGATLFAESLHGSLQWMRAMNYFMGFFFLGFAFFKLLNISGFADAFATYDILAKRSRFYAIVYPWIEVTLGLLFLSRSLLLVANLVTAVIMALGLVGVIAAVRRKQAIQCACLGTVFNLPMSVVTIVENSVMIVMATTMLFSLIVLS